MSVLTTFSTQPCRRITPKRVGVRRARCVHHAKGGGRRSRSTFVRPPPRSSLWATCTAQRAPRRPAWGVRRARCAVRPRARRRRHASYGGSRRSTDARATSREEDLRGRSPSAGCVSTTVGQKSGHVLRRGATNKSARMSSPPLHPQLSNVGTNVPFARCCATQDSWSYSCSYHKIDPGNSLEDQCVVMGCPGALSQERTDHEATMTAWPPTRRVDLGRGLRSVQESTPPLSALTLP